MIDFSAISSIIGLGVTIFLLVEARAIRKSFLRRARLPNVTRELSELTSEISSRLKNWSGDEKPVIESFARIKGLLENLKPKLPTEQQKQVDDFLRKLQPRKYLLLKAGLSELSEDKAWSLYADLNTVVTSLAQLVEDSRWE